MQGDLGQSGSKPFQTVTIVGVLSTNTRGRAGDVEGSQGFVDSDWPRPVYFTNSRPLKARAE